MKKKRGVLSLWKVIILVIVGILGVAGVTVLSLYLMGRFDKEYVEPENISFVEDVSDGAGYYNTTLGQYEVSSDFSMTITTTTENVTERKVTLSLKNGVAQNGYISDGIITVPQEVSLNQPFTVTLNTEYNSNPQILEDWIVGGVSTLTAKSSNVLLSAQTVTICVDVPVHGIDVQVAGSSQTGTTQDVVVGTTFTLDTIFYPTESKYLFSDETREKEVFYAFTSSYISYDWEEERFVAEQRSGNNTDTITVYTFANSYYQKQIMDMYSSITDRELLTSNVLRYLDDHPEARMIKTVNIKVLDIDVDSVEIGNTGNSFNTYLDQYFTLTTASANGDGKLDLSIKDSSGALLNSLFGNVGIKIPKNVEGLTILGGKVMEVVTTESGTTITQKDFDSTFDYSAAPEGTEYYILPNNTPKDFADYYWRFAASTAEEYTLAINFFFENEEGNWENFFAFSGETNPEKTITLVAEEHDYEEEPAWQTNDTIMLTINYDEEGNSIPGNIDLSKELNAINQENIYKTVRYFLLIDDKEVGYAEDLDMQSAFVCGPGKVYTQDYKGQTLAIAGTQTPDNGYTLYEIDGTVLTAIKSFSGKVKVIAATIKTDADNKPYVTEDGKYLIVKTSRVKDVMVESTLSIANMDPSITFATGILPNAENNNDYYIPAINRNETASQRTMITFELVLNNSEDTTTDSQKVITAFNSGNLKIACLDINGRQTNDYVTLQGLVEKNVGENEITFEGTLAIEEAYFSAGRNAWDKGTYIRLQLQYDDGKETYTKNVTIKDETKDYFYIYYQQPVSMKAEFEDQVDLDKDGDGVIDDIVVNITASNGISITWGDRKIQGTTEEVLSALNDLLTFTLTDQFGNVIEESSGIYNIRLVETPAEGSDDYILSFDSTLSKIQNFISTQGQEKTTTLTAYIVDREDNFVYAFDEAGNVTQDLMASQTLTFKIQSEGVKELKYDPTDIVGAINEDAYATSSSLSQVTVRKYVTSNQTIDMNTLLKVYTSGTDGQLTEAENVVYKLDESFISGLSSTNKVDIMKMIKFNSVATMDEEETDSIENYRDTVISTVNIINPFKEDTQIIFSVRDENESLFDITLILVLKADITVSQNFNAYYEENSDYLVTSGNAVSVFAGQTYDLAEYVTLSSHLGVDYSWTSALGALSLDSDPNGVFYSTQDFCSLSVVKEGDAVKQILLKIDDVYQFRTVSFTIYYGKNSFYACSITITLYVNPNILVRETVTDFESNPFVNLETLSSQALSSSYKLYKMTSYIENGGFDGAEEIISNTNTGSISLSYSNVSAEKYLTIEQNSIGTNVYNYYFVNGSSLSLTLGQKVEQKYQIVAQVVGSTTTQIVDAVKIIENGTDRQIVLCEKSGDLTVSLDIGFGSGSDENLASSVLKRDSGEEVNVVTYNGETHLMLVPDAKYNTQNDFSISDGSATGNVYSNSKTVLSTYNINGFVSLTGNTFNAEKTLTDTRGNSLTIEVKLSAIVSKIGDKYVYYNNETLPENVSDMEFNIFGDNDFSVIIGDYSGLQSAEIYQTLQAGQTYTIVHDSSEAITSSADAFGFYYDGNLTEVNYDSASYEISIVSNAEGYIDGLATLKTEGDNLIPTQLEINHLESSQSEAYIVLRFELYQYSGSLNYVWYYRIKVSPSFTIGSVQYPYNDGGEYLNTYSPYYDETTESYTIDLEEPFTAQNSKYGTGKRFGDIADWIGYDEGEEPTVTEQYTIKTAKIGENTISNFGEYFTYQFEGSKFNIKLVDNTTRLTLTLEKSFLVNGVKMIGSEMQYIMYFNQGENYVHSLKQSVNGGTETTLTAKNNKYSATVNAGSEEVVFIPDIKISSNGTESEVSEFSAYIAGNDMTSSLMVKSFVKAGFDIYTDETGETVKETLKGDLVVGDWKAAIESLAPNGSGIVTLTDTDGTKYFAKTEAIGWTCAYLDESQKLHIKPQETIKQDSYFEIGFFTDERVVFTIDLTVTSYFDWEINTGVVFKGGERYTIKSGANALFSKLEIDSTLSSLTITDFDLKLDNGDEIYSYVLTTDTELQEGKTYYTYNAETQTYAKVDELDVAKIDTYYEAGLTLKDLVYINNDATTYTDNTVEFSHLLKDTKFVFVGTLTDSGANTYSFNFELNVKSSFVLEQTRRVVDTTDRYGSVDFDIEIEELRSKIPDLMPIYDAPDGSELTKSAYKYVEDSSYVDTKKITPANVASSTLQSETFTVAYTFNEKEIFNFEVTYRFTVKPNVVVTANYPMPDEKTKLSTEYISTTQGADEIFTSEMYSAFFTSTAPFGQAKRIVVENVDALKDKDDLTKTWSISVASISNATVQVTGGVTKSINASSEDMTIVTNVDETTVGGLNIKFSIVNSSSNGLVTFDVTVNNVTTTYNIEIVAGSNIKISTNTPNYTNNRETIYAEDLAAQSSQYLFEQNRILSYSFNSSVVSGTTYYLRFTNSSNEVQIITLNAETLNQIVNVDLGKSYTGFSYAGTFTSRAGAEGNTDSLKVNDESIYLSIPALTHRIVAYYYDNTPIVFNTNVILMLTVTKDGSTTDKEANKFVLTNDDYGTTVNLGVSVKLGDETIETSGTYNLYLDIEFEVTGNADKSETYTTVEVNAGVERNLLSYTSFGIKNPRTGLLYDATSMYNSTGTFTLQIYGFSDTIKVGENLNGYDTNSEEENLAKTAGEIHNNLISTAGKDLSTDVVYSTGLSPRAGFDVNEANSAGELRHNYITISGVLNNGKTVDYDIYAQGSNNDGNYVMMRITYMVKIGEAYITESHNILFKVVPNSTIRFKSQHENAQNYNSSSTEIVNGQTVASNDIAPYQIMLSNISTSGDTVDFNLWNTESDTNATASVILANMYGQSSSSTSSFKFTYNSNLEKEGYNDNSDLIKDSLADWSNSSGVYTYNSEYTNHTTGNLQIKVKTINLGERKFIIEMENVFGFKVMFYFTITADVNPTIFSMSNSSLTEGDTIGVGLRFQTVTPSTTTEGNVMFEEFTYGVETGQSNPQNTISIKLNDHSNNFSITQIKLEATINFAIGEIPAGSVITKTLSPTTGNEITVTIVEGKENEWYYNGEAISKSSLTQTALNGASCVLSMKVERTPEKADGTENTAAVGNYSVKYGKKVLNQVYTVSSSYQEPVFTGSGAIPTTEVRLSGIGAYGFSNTMGAVNVDSLKNDAQNQDLTSKIDKIKVTKIEFYLGDTWLGGTYRTSSGYVSTSVNASYNPTDAQKIELITNSDYSFVTEVTPTTEEQDGSAEIQTGAEYSESTAFVVPTISGIYYGTGRTVSNVKMNITLVDTTQEDEECVVSEYITLNRKASTEDLFDSDIFDTKSPQATKTVYNDTLEIVLDPGESITFAVNDKEIKSINADKVMTYEDGGEKTKTAKLITLTNSKTYTVTEYVGISASINGLEENLTTSDRFYVFVTALTDSPIIKYNGSQLLAPTDSGATANRLIGRYLNSSTALTMNIENVGELLSNNTKTETLYFLYPENDQVYQYVNTFNIKPLYDSATTDEGNYFKVEDYYIVSNSSNSSTYYIIPLTGWGREINLSGVDNRTLSGVGTPYKFFFEINTSTGGSGSAFIDENGMITTTEDFDIVSHTITVNVYMKMSGANGAFEESSTRVQLGSFRIYLDGDKTPSESAVSSGVYWYGSSVITIPTNYTLRSVGSFGTGFGSDLMKGTVEKIDLTYATEVGNEVDFTQIYSGSKFTYNTTFHLVHYKEETQKTETYVYFNNLDSWTFTQAGTYELTLVVTGRDSTTAALTNKVITATIIVYETSTKEEQQYAGSTGDDFNEAFDSSYTWYLLNEDGSIEMNVTTFSPGAIGIYTNTYIAQPNATGETKLVTKTFYVYDNTTPEEKSVALRPTTTFQLSNLVTATTGQTAEFYKIETVNSITKRVSESFAMGENTSTKATYVVVIRNSDGEYVSVKNYEVTYKFISSNVTEEAMFVATTDEMDEKVQEKAANTLGVEAGKISSIEKMSSSGILETENRLISDVKGEDGQQLYLITQNYIVTYTNAQGSTRYARFSFSFYVYDRALDINKETTINNAYRLSDLNSDIATAIGEGSASDILGYYQLNGTDLQQVETVVLEETTTKTYYVRTNNGYYLVTINFTIS